MKFALASDIHLEFGRIELMNTESADVLVLAGDICVAKDLMQRDEYGLMGLNNNNAIHTFFQTACEQFPNVIYIMGNHEHYHGDFATSLGRLREHLGYLKNLHIMEKEFIELNGVIFVAGTLFTDMNKEDPNTLFGIKGYMNDYRIIDNSNNPPVIFKGGHFNEANQWVDDPWGTNTRPAKFTPEDSVEDHKKMMAFIRDTLNSRNEPDTKFVVVGHHAPSKLSTKPQYEKDVMVNGAYSSDLSEFILDRPQIKVWCHGHTHHSFDYMLGSTRIVANPRGYHDYEDQADRFQLQYIEV